jgi:uncharacterized membrane protein
MQQAPVRFTFKYEIFPLIIILAYFVFGIYFYMHFPKEVISHWGFSGKGDKYTSKAIAAFLIPAIAALIYLLLTFLPFIDPHKENYRHFEKAYHSFRTSLLLTLFAIFLASGYYNLGYNVPVNTITLLALGLLFFVLGYFMASIKTNWFFGIRTPWTLSSEIVWDKSHYFGSKLFRICGLLIILSAFLPKTLALIIFFGSIICAVFGSIIYSYFAYRSEKK